MFTFQVLFLCLFLHFGRGRNTPSSNQVPFPKLLGLLKVQVQIEKVGDVLHKECPTLFQRPDIKSILQPVIGKRQSYFGASSEEIEFRIRLAKHTLDFLTKSYLKCKAGSLKVTTPAPDPCDSQPCQNNGTCSASEDTAICACLPGFTGATCDVAVDHCRSQPCQNGATCVNGTTTHSCICPDRYTGSNCEICTY
ncbi:versican core protein-like [Lingula anatina]|uniref:Versican core protein-like n=1 Tax=Lingula anatina TaxID=7574 RepID=A0A1S3J818_LINAN|nr:versican core protein-like [Lingula anatina]|eukprot:XP_013406547.1 versican core protein-like [Lingula anatina]